MGWAVTQSLPQHCFPHPPASLPPLAGSLLSLKPLRPHSTQARKEMVKSICHAKTSPVYERETERMRETETEMDRKNNSCAQRSGYNHAVCISLCTLSRKGTEE